LQVCSIVFHAGCEDPQLTWTPTETFCSPFCFEHFKRSSEGAELFRTNCMLVSGHLRRYAECMSNAQIDAAKLAVARRGMPLYEPNPPLVLKLEVGQCVSLRAGELSCRHHFAPLLLKTD
jgi:hypothetical protein